MLLDAAAATLTETAIARALAGDDVALRFCLARIVAPRRQSAVELDLPPLDTQKDLALAMAAVGEAAAQGVITPSEARDLARVGPSCVSTASGKTPVSRAVPSRDPGAGAQRHLRRFAPAPT